MLNEYQKAMFKNFEKIQDTKWYAIKEDRQDRKELIECLKLQIDAFGNFEFNKDFTAFRRAYPWRTLLVLNQDNSETMKMIDKMQIDNAHKLGLSWTKRKK